MSFDKDYPNRKDHRKPFKRLAEKYSVACRHGGSCTHCSKDRQINQIKSKLVARQELKLIDENVDEEILEAV